MSEPRTWWTWVIRGWALLMLAAFLAMAVGIILAIFQVVPQRLDAIASAIFTAGAVLLGAGFGLLAALVGRPVGLRPFMALAMLGAVAATIVAVLGIWVSQGALDRAVITATVLRIAVTGGLLAVILPWFARAMSRDDHAAVPRWLRRGLGGSLLAVLLGGLLIQWSKILEPYLIVPAAVAALGLVGIILFGPGLLFVGMLIRRRDRRDAAGVSRRSQVTLVCPDCGEEAERPTGLSPCPTCGTPIIIDVKEPRCMCGYLLYQLAGDSCPECGRVVPEDLRPRQTEPSPPSHAPP